VNAFQAVALILATCAAIGLAAAIPDLICDHRRPDPKQPDTHTRTSTPEGPDFCAECSAAAVEWVRWPCPDGEPDPEPPEWVSEGDRPRVTPDRRHRPRHDYRDKCTL